MGGRGNGGQTSGPVFVVDDDPCFVRTAQRVLRAAGFDVLGFTNACEALRRVSECALLITDLVMPELDGIELCRKARQRKPALPVLFVSGQPTVPCVFEAGQLGAADFFEKPVDDEKLVAAARHLLNSHRDVSDAAPPDVFAGSSLAARRLADEVQKAARLDMTVLIVGETGSGKELVANAIHARSARSSGPFVTLNSAGIPETLVESELFGHKKGAFTGAVAAYGGHFRAADGGILFLDEIGDMPKCVQPKLLRVLQDHVVTALGSSTGSKIDVRVIAATNRDLRSMVREGNFREDLFYRINVLEVVVPPLRERAEDIAVFARHFLEQVAHRDSGECRFDDAALECIERYDWPGNLRELENIVARAFASARDATIRVSDLPPEVRDWSYCAPEQTADVPSGPRIVASSLEISDVEPLRDSLARTERQSIAEALRKTGGNKTEAAAVLGLNRTTLFGKLKKLGVSNRAGRR